MYSEIVDRYIPVTQEIAVTPIQIRASSFGTLTDCAARWKAIHIDGVAMPSSVAAHLGTSIHAGTAAYDQSVLDGLPLRPAEAVGALVDTLYDPNADVDWSTDDTPKKKLEAMATKLHTMYCEEIAPTQDYIAVEEALPPLEVPFRDSGISIVLTGHVDRIRHEDGLIGVGDLKSGAGRNAVSKDADGNLIVSTSKHIAQLGIYELLTEAAIGHALLAPAAVYGMKTGSNPAVAVGYVQSPKDVVLGREGAPGLLELVARMLAHEIFVGNPRSMLCSQKYCPVFQTCHWRKGF